MSATKKKEASFIWMRAVTVAMLRVVVLEPPSTGYAVVQELSVVEDETIYERQSHAAGSLTVPLPVGKLK